MPEERELLFELKTGETRPLLERPPILSSAKMEWRGILLEHHPIVPFDNSDISLINNVVFLQRAAALSFEWKRDGDYRPFKILPGQLSIVPADMPHSARSLDAQGEFVSVSVEKRFLAYAACDFTDPDKLELTPVIGSTDPLIEGICLTLHNEVQAGGPGGRLYSDALATTLALHLVRTYSTREPRTLEYRGGLQKHHLRRAIEFINEHLEKDISLNSISSAVGISPFHFARQFKQSTGVAPHQYLLRCRIERARQMLLRPQNEIADVAVQVGFCDQSHFTRHFKRLVGVTPKKFVREMAVRRELA